MAILKSEVIGKPINKFVGINTGGNHPIWNSFTVDAVDFLSRCTLQHANSYGATYKIDPTSELTIVHSDGTKYPVASYSKLLTMIITDYTESTGATMPTQPQPGTHWERLRHLADHSPKGEIVTIETVSSKYIHFSGNRDLSTEEFLKRFKSRSDLDTPASEPIIRRKLAFYKKSEEPWTEEELDNVRTHLGDTSNRRPMPVSTTKRKYIYSIDTATESDLRVYVWDDQSSPKTMSQVAYESVFETSTIKPVSTKTTKPKTKPVVQPEPITPTPIKETFMTKIKDSASATVDQNKQALVIASKMEAGRIINKQVLKQLKPHLPFFLQGYASSPFAPFLAANLVAMTANYVDDSRVKKISELMLLGAADSGVSSLNISKIIDDVLSNIKLPAGVLDDSDDE